MFPNQPPNRKMFKPAKILFFVAVVLAIVFVLGTVVMLLWNAILPKIAGVKPLDLWQAIGLLVLSRILFGGFKPGSPPWKDKRDHFRSKKAAWKEKWMNMSEEERQEFKNRWRKRCGKD